jgi:hypothetical protein
VLSVTTSLSRQSSPVTHKPVMLLLLLLLLQVWR